MEQLPLVSVVTPSFNQGQYIEETIRSVLEQDYPHIEYWVIDGGSTDTTLQVLHRYSDRVSWVSEADRGQSHAINKGWQRSTGQILAWLNSDDIYKPWAVRTAVEAFRAHPETALVYGELDIVTADRKFLQKAPIEPPNINRLLFGNIIGQPNAFVARWAIDQVGAVNEDLRYEMDHELWLRVVSSYPAHFMPGVLAEFRIHDVCKNYAETDRFAPEWLRVLQREPPIAAPSRYTRMALAQAYAGTGFYWRRNEDYRRAAACFLRAFMLDAYHLRNQGMWMTMGWALLGNRLARRLHQRIGARPSSEPDRDFHLDAPDPRVQ